MALGKSIKLFLVDGEINGIMTGEISNWTGKAYKIPRVNIDKAEKRKELEKAGVYFLFGKNDEEHNVVYIGQAISIITRLKQHVAKKDFWSEAIVFISKDENLNKAHIQYLESKLCDLAKSTKRYIMENTNSPLLYQLSEADEAEMEEFINYIKILTDILGHKVFENKVDIGNKESNEFEYITKKGVNAAAILTVEGVVVLKGSIGIIEQTKSLSVGSIKLKNQLLKDGIIENRDGKMIFMDDYIFSSPSKAADIICGNSVSGPLVWKEKKTGKSMKELGI